MTATIRAKQKIQYQEGREAEFFFRKWTGAEDAPSHLEAKHIDCIWGEYTVDVKGLKRSHIDGYVLVEFKNVAGKDGWAKNGADKIAFQFPEGFYVVNTKELHKMAQRKVIANPSVSRTWKPVVGASIAPSSGLYMLIQRPQRKDLFTYIRKEDLLSLDHVLINEKSK